jgi:hypothetical protein
VADAGYGSEENYKHVLEKEGRIPLISYGMFLKEQKRSYKKDIFNRNNWEYNENADVYLCPIGRLLQHDSDSVRTDKNGFTRQFKNYTCENCDGCGLKETCTKAIGDRKIQINEQWEAYKAQVSSLLKEGETSKIYKRRKIDVEPVFGDVKQNMDFTRMHVRGKEKVKQELGFVFLAHNLKKLCTRVKKYEGKTVIQGQIA